MPTRDALELFDMTAPAVARPVDTPTRRPPPPPPPQAPARTTRHQEPAPRPPAQRPPYADDIDAIVAGMVADGFVTLDLERDAYRTTRRRAWRFAEEAQP